MFLFSRTERSGKGDFFIMGAAHSRRIADYSTFYKLLFAVEENTGSP